MKKESAFRFVLPVLLILLCFNVFNATANAAVPTSGDGSILNPWVINTDTRYDASTGGAKVDHYYTFTLDKIGYITPYALRTGSTGTTWNSISIYQGEVDTSNLVYKQTVSSETFASAGSVGLRPGKYIIYARMRECSDYALQINFTESQYFEEEIDSTQLPKEINPDGSMYYGETSNGDGDTADYYTFTLAAESNVAIYAKTDTNYYMGISIFRDSNYSNEAFGTANNNEHNATIQLDAGTYYVKITNGLSAATHYGYQFSLKATQVYRHLEWKTVGEKSYWYENNVRQGTYDDENGVMGTDPDTGIATNRGREIFDPESNGWYWLDSIYDGAKAVNKEVWMPYIYQNEKNWDEAEINSNAESSSTYVEDGLEPAEMADQVRNAIKNKTGKWVRYDENGKMFKGWVTITNQLATIYPDQKGNTYFYDYKTGLMAKGWTVIGGIPYYFDEITGVLQMN